MMVGGRLWPKAEVTARRQQGRFLGETRRGGDLLDTAALDLRDPALPVAAQSDQKSGVFATGIGHS